MPRKIASFGNFEKKKFLIVLDFCLRKRIVKGVRNIPYVIERIHLNKVRFKLRL